MKQGASTTSSSTFKASQAKQRASEFDRGFEESRPGPGGRKEVRERLVKKSHQTWSSFGSLSSSLSSSQVIMKLLGMSRRSRTLRRFDRRLSSCAAADGERLGRGSSPRRLVRTALRWDHRDLVEGDDDDDSAKIVGSVSRVPPSSSLQTR
mmetsp:Transcript_21021/g.67732  ORF Transcript_21021/g.67732 Transcript_21021/m.67732 type:complete len:151 (+) Transcript_21021:822-1274(+)